MIPILDLKVQYDALRDEIVEALLQVMESGNFILGPDVKALEREVAEYCGTRYAIGMASGTDALRLSFPGLDIGAGDEVITTPFTFVATANTISHSGARPVFVDIDPATYNLDPDAVAAAVTPRTKAIYRCTSMASLQPWTRSLPSRNAMAFTSSRTQPRPSAPRIKDAAPAAWAPVVV